MKKSIADVYQYKSLQYEDSIRLLHIQPGQPQDLLQCHLEEARLLDEPYYVALSYTWGVPDKVMTVHMIDINATNTDDMGDSRAAFTGLDAVSETPFFSLAITMNLFEALQAVRKTDDLVKLWVDAICINQEDLEERSRQVQIMSSIYGLASLVVVWLGPADDESEMAFDWVELACDSWLELSEQRKLMGNDDEDPQELIDWWDRARIGHEDLWWALTSTFTADGDRKWWERKWVIQEQACAKKVLFSCGKRGLWQVALFSAISLLRDRNRMGRVDLPVDDGIDYRFVATLVHSVEYHLNWTSQAKGIQAPFTVEEAIAEAFYTKASDPRDEIYALLSVCHFPTRRIIPDYTKSILAVYLEATEVMLRDRQNLEPLCGGRVIDTGASDNVLSWCTEEEKRVPSWVPDMRGRLFRKPNLVMSMFYRACGEYKLDLEETFSHSVGILALRAIYFDQIDEIGRNVPIDEESVAIDDDTYRDWVFANSDILNAEPVLPLHRQTQLMCTDLRQANITGPARRIRPEDLDELCRAHSHLCHAAGLDTHARLSTLEASTIDSPLSTDESSLQGIETDASFELRFRLRRHIQGSLVLCKMKSGRLGWIPTTAQVGDQLFIVYGSNVPFVLRPLSDELSARTTTERCRAFTMVGTAYVYGIMDGELVEDESTVKASEQLIYLH